VLTGENLDDLLARAAYRTRAEVDHLVASVQARSAPRAGIRKLPERESAPASVTLPLAPGPAEPAAEAAADTAPPSDADSATMPLAGSPPPHGPRGPAGKRPRRASELRAVTGSQWSLRVTIDRACKDDLDTLTSLLAHKIPDGDLAAVLHEAIRCAVEKHGKRRGAVAPAKKVSRKTPNAARRVEPASTIPAVVRREVWARDGGCCAYVAPDGRRCKSRWKLEIDHIHPAALGGTPTVDNLRLACRAHNLLHAERTYGREHMDRFRHRTDAEAPRPRAGRPLGPAVQSVLWGT
jgi:5-methylcytosine-specific restriction endonuclease McrA